MTAARHVVIVGGGVIGSGIAFELARRGVAVTLVERGRIGGEGAWAAAGHHPPPPPALDETGENRARTAEPGPVSGAGRGARRAYRVFHRLSPARRMDGRH